MKSILDARDSVHKSQTMANEFLEQTAYTKEAVMRGNDGLRRVRDKTFGVCTSEPLFRLCIHL